MSGTGNDRDARRAARTAAGARRLVAGTALIVLAAAGPGAAADPAPVVLAQAAQTPGDVELSPATDAAAPAAGPEAAAGAGGAATGAEGETAPDGSEAAPRGGPAATALGGAGPPADAGAGGAEGLAAAPGRDATLPRDLSPWGMFLAADVVVKAVMVGLAIASVLTWAVWFAKSLEIAGARMRARRALRAVAGARTLDEAWRGVRGRGGPGAEIVRAAAAEAELSAEALPHAGGEGLKERVVSRLARIEAAAARRMARGTGLLATIGATAPFVGLFGTVWGIMNSFIGISEAQTTNLAVVAPGIAEALLATALGLIAAIPAVVIYNHFARSLAGYRLLLGDVAAATLRLVSRDLDFGHLPPGAARAPDETNVERWFASRAAE